MRQYVSTVTVKGQVTIPSEIRRLLELSSHDKVAFIVDDGEVRIAPATSVVERTAGMLSGGGTLRSVEREMIDVEEAMAEEAEQVSDAIAVP